MPAKQPFWGEVFNNGADYWGIIFIADLEFVGYAELTGGVSRDIQINKPKGSDGASLTDNGYKPAQVSITLKLVTQTDWDDFQEVLLPAIHPRRKGGPRSPVVLTHPALNVLGVTRIYFTSIGAPKIGSDKIGTVEMKAIEWFPAPKPVKKAAGKGRTAPRSGAAGINNDAEFYTIYGFQQPSEFALEGIGF